ncbi:hypothetical protein FBU30_005737 [Linnemannia zychae]|nr:hypothetical protein FBU30_005737 [Linnemannia zychae]
MMLHPGSQASAELSYSPASTTARRDGKQNKDATAGASSTMATPTSIATTSRKQGDYLTALAIMRPSVLDYDVHSCSSYSASYLPENIKTNNPQDQSSRWSSEVNNQMQYIMIKLKTMAIAQKLYGQYPYSVLPAPTGSVTLYNSSVINADNNSYNSNKRQQKAPQH